MKLVFIVGTLLVLGLWDAIFAEGTAKDSVILLTNDICALELHPDKGGMCSSFDVKAFKFALQPGADLFREVFVREGMEGECKTLKFEAQLKGGAADGMQVELTAKLDAANADESVAGLELRRVMKLAPGKRCVEVSQVLKNGTKDVMGALMGTRQKFSLDEIKGQDMFMLPSERSVLRITGSSIDSFYARSSDWEYQVAEGWMAALNRRGNLGVVFVLDPKCLDSFYCKSSSGVNGWFVDGGILNPGNTLETGYWVIPVKGFEGITYASRRMIADLRVKVEGGGVGVVHTIAGARDALGDVELKVSVYGARSKATKNLAPIKIQNVGVDPVTGVSAMDQPQSEPIVIRVVVSGKDWTETYEAYHEGEFRTTIYPGYPYDPEYRRPKITRK